MDDDKVNQPKKNRVNWKILVLIAIVILVGISIAAIQEYMKSQSQRLIPIDPLSEKGKSLTEIAEKTLKSEGIDMRYLHLRSIVKYPSDSTILSFIGAKTFYSANIYTNHNLTDKGTTTLFAADLGRYDIATYFTIDKQVKVYDKNARVESEIWEYGKNYSLNLSNNFLEISDSRSNKVKLKILNYIVIQNEEQIGTIVKEINRKFEHAQLEFHIDREEPVVIIDTSSNTGDLFVDVAFYNSQLSNVLIEETTKESENGWGRTKVTHTVKYFNAS